MSAVAEIDPRLMDQLHDLARGDDVPGERERLYEHTRGPGDPVRIAVMATRALGKAVIENLLREEGIQLAAIVERDDEKLQTFCTENSVPWVFGGKGNWEFACFTLRKWGAEAILAAHWNLYVPEEVRRSATWGVLAYHPSILPRWRGNESVKDSQADGVIGGTVYQMDDGLDTGPIVKLEENGLVQASALNNWTGDPSGMWRECLFPMGVTLLSMVARSLCRGHTLEFVEQMEGRDLRESGQAA